MFMIYILCLCVFGISINCFSQKENRFLHTYQYQDYHYIDTDTSRIWYTYNIPNLIIVSMSKSNGEYFVISDTLNRDYILLDNKKYLIDSLCLKKYDDYAMLFEYSGTYCIEHGQAKYLIIVGDNGFQMGTDSQPRYMIFQKKGDEYIFHSSYILEDIDFYSEEILNSVNVIFESDNIILQGINLKCVRGCI